MTLVFGDKRQELEHEVGNERVDQVTGLTGIEQQHVENSNISADLFGELASLFLNLAVVAPQSVDGIDDDHVALSQSLEEPFILPMKQNNIFKYDLAVRQKIMLYTRSRFVILTLVHQ